MRFFSIKISIEQPMIKRFSCFLHCTAVFSLFSLLCSIIICTLGVLITPSVFHVHCFVRVVFRFFFFICVRVRVCVCIVWWDEMTMWQKENFENNAFSNSVNLNSIQEHRANSSRFHSDYNQRIPIQNFIKPLVEILQQPTRWINLGFFILAFDFSVVGNRKNINRSIDSIYCCSKSTSNDRHWQLVR